MALMSDLSEGEDDASFRISLFFSFNRLISKECIHQLIGPTFYFVLIYLAKTLSADPLESFMSVVSGVKIPSLTA